MLSIYLKASITKLCPLAPTAQYDLGVETNSQKALVQVQKYMKHWCNTFVTLQLHPKYRCSYKIQTQYDLGVETNSQKALVQLQVTWHKYKSL